MTNTMWEQFSQQAKEYARYRPLYPPELYRYLAQAAPANNRVLDCGTGSGQAAVGLAEHFERVTATDANARQIGNAFAHPRIDYLLSVSERLPLADGSLDLLTVAQAVHWFDLERFFTEARRVVRPGGVVAVWMYPTPQCTPEIVRVLDVFYNDIVGPYWSSEVHWVNAAYTTLPFPFEEIQAPEFIMQADWKLENVLGMLESWSAVIRCREQTGNDPMEWARREMRTAWGDAQQTRTITWPVYMRIGRV